MSSTSKCIYIQRELSKRTISPRKVKYTSYSCRHIYELIRCWRSAALPPGVNITRVYTDYMTYLIENTQRHLQNYLLWDVWGALHDKAEIIVAHPNHWGSREQDILEQAAVNAKIVSKKGSKRLHFVEEAEASASYLMTSKEALMRRLTVSTLRCFLHMHAFDEFTRLELHSLYAMLVDLLQTFPPIKFWLRGTGRPFSRKSICRLVSTSQPVSITSTPLLYSIPAQASMLEVFLSTNVARTTFPMLFQPRKSRMISLTKLFMTV